MDPQSPPPTGPQPIQPQVVAEPQAPPLRVVLEEPRRLGNLPAACSGSCWAFRC